MAQNPVHIMLKRLLIVIAFGIAFAYIESAVVVYLRAVFYPDGFRFPLAVFDITATGKRLFLTEIGREGATLVLMGTAAWLVGQRHQERAAWFLIIFAVWDLFYYVWLKVLLDWPASILDWDVLFLIPAVWAAPVLYPVLVSVAMLAFGIAILHRGARGRPLAITYTDGFGFTVAVAIVIISFCIGGAHITEPDYRAYFWPLLFALGYGLGLVACLRPLLRASKGT